MRWIEEEKQLKNSFFFACAKISSSLRAHRAFAGRIAAAVDVGGVLQQGKHTLLAQFSKRVQVERLVIRRRQIDLEVARMQDDSDRRMDRQRHAIHQRVGHADRHDGEGSQRNAAAGNHLDQVGIIEQIVLFELALRQGQRELGSVDGNIQLGEDPRQAADVVFMPMGQKDRADLVAVFRQVTDVGNNNINAQQLFFRKHQAGVDDNNVILPADGHAVHTELAEATQRNQLQFILCHQP